MMLSANMPLFALGPATLRFSHLRVGLLFEENTDIQELNAAHEARKRIEAIFCMRARLINENRINC